MCNIFSEFNIINNIYDYLLHVMATDLNYTHTPSDIILFT